MIASKFFGPGSRKVGEKIRQVEDTRRAKGVKRMARKAQSET